ncbi:helix-turn-helix domain-containing protein [Planococcus sp. CAU13]|uniref:helix-turn-helix domain-containing protein n=1 Tax=Planococcus sp. CAU13 TaxID=1541197 RepID=UPI00052FF27B|nr:helix-turn-helix transcriptional regulator [Planococcus sp. CAU13]
MVNNTGTLFKEIRRNKNFSQEFMAKGVLTQSAYSKFELGKNEISYSSYIQLLEKLEMTQEEFAYIQNEYNYNPHEKLLLDFFNLPFNDPKQLNAIIKTSREILKNAENEVVADIAVICEALILLVETNDMEQARKKAEVVWSRLADRHYWYLSEIKIINTILFLFPSAAAKEMTRKVKTNLKRYGNFKEANRLIGILNLNLSFLLIREQEYAEALRVIEHASEVFKEYSMYKHLAAAYVRKGICLSQLTLSEGKEEADKGILMLELLEDYTLRDILIGEMQRYGQFQQ